MLFIDNDTLYKCAIYLVWIKCNCNERGSTYYVIVLTPQNEIYIYIQTLPTMKQLVFQVKSRTSIVTCGILASENFVYIVIPFHRPRPYDARRSISSQDWGRYANIYFTLRGIIITVTWSLSIYWQFVLLFCYCKDLSYLAILWGCVS